MMTILTYLIPFLLAFFGMEFMAWFTHKYIMHGFLWFLHEDHHQPDPNTFFEKNDAFFLVYAIPSWLCIMLGMMWGNTFSVGFGFGILAYGVTYFLVHDVLIHRRFKWFDKVQSPYFKALRKAHKVHHKNRFKEEGSCFGLLVVPRKFYQEQKKKR
ncbi:sterol desaturase family protein [Aureispira sp. CCB-QB1]|uniref:sterol desaturase family protein n=1 Tax=Aureispira sp. CCB-QB1 TaxID=1313421 RepID=UPI0018CC54BB|nr:sterol desaturase family protein [Aureispira sp. CCB-QB1]